MTTEELLADALTAQGRERRYRRIEVIVVAAVLLLAVIFGPIAYTATQRQEELRDLSRQSVCIAEATADAIGGIADALAAPPAPNTSREQAVHDILRAARKLHDVGKMCPGP